MPSELPITHADKPLLAVLRGERRDPVPMWMMRQAGRYLPEYRALREEKGSFLDLVYDSDAAAEVTLQPLRRFAGLDAAILFSDILIVPFAIGQNLSFVTWRGAAADAAAGRWRARPVDGISGAAGADLRDCRARSRRQLDPRNDVDRLCREVPGRSRPIWSRARAAASRPRRGASPMRDPASFRRDHRRGSRRSRSTICQARSKRAPRRCNCSTAGRAACHRRSSSAG